MSSFEYVYLVLPVRSQEPKQGPMAGIGRKWQKPESLKFLYRRITPIFSEL